MPKTKEFVTSSSESDGEVQPPKKKQKAKEKEEKPKSSVQKNDAGEIQFALSRMRFATVREFRGKVLVDIREFYEKDGEMKPGKKGISLTGDQWNKLKEQVDEIDAAVKEL